MEVSDVLERFSLIAGLSAEEASPWVDICSDAAESIVLQLKDGVDEKVNEKRLISAAASLSFYKYILYRASGEGMNTFAAGDIKITQDKKQVINSAYTAWCIERDAIADLLDDDHFLFRKVDLY